MTTSVLALLKMALASGTTTQEERLKGEDGTDRERTPSWKLASCSRGRLRKLTESYAKAAALANSAIFRIAD